ncbi:MULTISPECIES: acyltransferase family protein [Paenibacillus]|uniref:Acyltransferase 3 domain-containing protein n=1 Tax=Paenibacillus lautus TaxID=1401 RepID=A0A1R1B5D3_PAELA|nr:acyltransferase [Paenibacillus lautus]OME94771.1 hypothetical protein BK123_06595 [Paenibacillus lautus]
MTSKTNYGGLDWLKFFVAFLVIANHTSPVGSFNPQLDFLISGVLTRIAVPIFFMSTGFFYFRKWTGDRLHDRKALYGYLKKIGKLYATVILIYIPLNVYTGYFTNEFTLYSLLRDIIFDGTFYHLWYLPALILGILITSFLYKKMSLISFLAAAVFLYIIGLLGDSYYGSIEGTGISQIYDVMFHLFDYTRNGLFYAPVYLALGALVARKQTFLKNPAINGILFMMSLDLMLLEGILLNYVGIPRHDSMYIFALPASYFLFQWAFSWKGKSNKRFREWRVWIYILHPIAIVLVRGVAKVVHLESFLIMNSLLHFVAVCLVSIAMAAAAARIYGFPLKQWWQNSSSKEVA